MFDREPMPLRRRIGHNCVFYAVPDACDFFNGQPLDENLIPQFRKEQERRMSLFKTFSGSTGVAGGFEISLQMILSHLGKFKIKPIKLFLGDENIAQAISSFNYQELRSVILNGA